MKIYWENLGRGLMVTVPIMAVLWTWTWGMLCHTKPTLIVTGVVILLVVSEAIGRPQR